MVSERHMASEQPVCGLPSGETFGPEMFVLILDNAPNCEVVCPQELLRWENPSGSCACGSGLVSVYRVVSLSGSRRAHCLCALRALHWRWNLESYLKTAFV